MHAYHVRHMGQAMPGIYTTAAGPLRRVSGPLYLNGKKANAISLGKRQNGASLPPNPDNTSWKQKFLPRGVPHSIQMSERYITPTDIPRNRRSRGSPWPAPRNCIHDQGWWGMQEPIRQQRMQQPLR